jgi:hypothetical protein
MSDRFERDVLIGVGRLTWSPFKLLGYFMIFMLWISVVAPLMAVIWFCEAIGIAVVMYVDRRWEWPTFTPVIGLDWIRSFEHPSHRRRRAQRQARRREREYLAEELDQERRRQDIREALAELNRLQRAKVR